VARDDVDRFFAESDPSVADVARAARRLVLDVLPDALETLDRADRIVGYATGPRPIKDLWAGIAPHRRHVNLQLANGALVEDPDGLVEGTGKRVRHVKLRSIDDVERPELRRLLEVSLAAHRASGGPPGADPGAVARDR
jgi:Domain of unknown function (DU1801)